MRKAILQITNPIASKSILDCGALAIEAIMTAAKKKGRDSKRLAWAALALALNPVCFASHSLGALLS